MDVAARVVLGLVQTIGAAGYDTDAALAGMPFTRADLEAWRGRVAWNDYIELFERLAAITGHDGMLRALDNYEDHFPEFRALAGAVISPAHYARLHCLMVASSWAAVRTTYDVNDARVYLRGDLPSDLRGSELFFEASVHVARSIPTFLGYPKPEADGRWWSHGFEVTVPLPPSRAIPTRVKRAVVTRGADAVRLMASVLGDFPISVERVRGAAVTPTKSERHTAVVNAWGLTARESETLALLVDGKSNKEIAVVLGCSVRTAEIHVSRVLAKSGCATRAEVSAAYWRPA